MACTPKGGKEKRENSVEKGERNVEDAKGQNAISKANVRFPCLHFRDERNIVFESTTLLQGHANA